LAYWFIQSSRFIRFILSLKNKISIMRRLSLCLLLLTVQFSLKAQPSLTTAPSAKSVMDEAFSRAVKENKNVIVMFHASWCGWCHRMDSSLNDPSCKKFFDDNYVITHLVVDESTNRKAEENAGAYELRTKYHGDGVGIPFWLIFDKNGKMLADSKLRKDGENEAGGNNIGCPARADEVEYFLELLKKTSKINADQLAIISARFKKNAD
jgi:thioredoxin-related protein